jgi:hypothetical protein
MQMSVRFLEIRQVFARRFDQPVHIEEPCSGESFVARNSFEHLSFGQEVSDADAR